MSGRQAGAMPGRMLGLDLGERRIGVAISDELGMIASPLTMVPRQGPVVKDVLALIERYGIVRVIVGMPTSLSGREGPQAASIRAYAESIRAELGVPLDYWDERMTTSIAEQHLIASGVRRDKRKQQVDAMAAAVMLQGYLDRERIRAGR
ncbi:MAG: Holliday junction resolvase RuvX [Thermomicrobiales bacterium]|jgi:putative holliday junction resolvase